MAYIIKPLVTEKMNNITDKRANRYGFVAPNQERGRESVSCYSRGCEHNALRW